MIIKNHNLKAIILAAGQGKRLLPLTKNKPKCLVELFGKSLLCYQIDTLQKCGITDISVVRGYMSDQISFPDISYFENFDYQNTNMLETLFCANEKLSDSVIVCYGDIIFEERILNELLTSTDDISIVIDKNWKKYWTLRFKNPLDDAESLVIDRDGFIKEIGQKTDDINKIQAQYIGLMKFSGEGLAKIKTMYEKFKKMSKNGTNPLNPNLSFEKSFLTDFLQALITGGCNLKAVPIHSGWLELDSLNDYNLYKKLHDTHELGKLITL